MAIAVIYNQTQRRRAVDWLEPLAKSGWEFLFAPLGFDVGSDAWKNAVLKSFHEAEAAVALLTKEAADDESVAWRIQAARDHGINVAPVNLDFTHFYPPTSVLSKLQWLRGDDRGRQYLGEYLTRFASRRPRCFVSYSRDDIEFASKLCVDLRAAGYEVWRDQDNIEAGTEWDDAIENAL